MTAPSELSDPRLRQEYLERCTFYKAQGYDMLESRRQMVSCAWPLAGRILEVGCGRGHMTLTLAQAGYSLTALDISEEHRRFVGANLRAVGLDGKVQVAAGDAFQLPYPDNSFDQILSINTLHHFDDPLKALDEMVRVRSELGRIILADFNEKGFQLMEKIHQIEGNVHPRGILSMTGAAAHLQGGGFSMKRYDLELETLCVFFKGM